MQDERSLKTGGRVVEWREGQLVTARCRIVEDDVEPDADAGPCEPGWVHSEPGDLGRVIDAEVFDDGACLPTVRFERTGTATLCGPREIALVEAN